MLLEANEDSSASAISLQRTIRSLEETTEVGIDVTVSLDEQKETLLHAHGEV